MPARLTGTCKSNAIAAMRCRQVPKNCEPDFCMLCDAHKKSIMLRGLFSSPGKG